MTPLEYYSQDKIQEEIAKLAKDRELAVNYGEKGFGKRPDILQFRRDVFEFAKQGATSFHFSEEHWFDPLRLKPGMTRRELDENRKGFDIVLDIDTKNVDYAKETAYILLEAIKFYGVKNVSCKFSGGSGFHIGIPMKALPKVVKGRKIEELFPECPRIVAMFLKNMITPKMKERITGVNDVFDVVDIDTVLISSRHMFRGAYSVNEKSGMASLPINPSEVREFNKDMAKLENVKPRYSFLDEDKAINEEAKYLVVSAFDWHEKTEKREEGKKDREKSERKERGLFDDKKPVAKVKEEFFPPCIQRLGKGMESDGRKRALFILINFLSNSGYSHDEVSDYITAWNKKNYEPLREGYVNSQLMWHKRQGKSPLPPNCSNKDYYSSLGICTPDNWCKFIKNPVNYATRKLRVMEENESRNKKKIKKKRD